MMNRSCAALILTLSLALTSCASKPVPLVNGFAGPMTTVDVPASAAEPANRDLALAASANFKTLIGTPRVLFVGNSLTGYNNLPGLVKSMANAVGYSPYVEAFIHFNTTLETPLEDKKFRGELVSRNWDFVVIQEWSNLPAREQDEFIAHVAEFSKILKGTKTSLLLFQNWPYRASAPDAMDKLNKAYDAAVRATGVKVIHIGRAFHALKMSTNIDLYAKDDLKHPSPIGSYLGALMISQAIFDLPPRGAQHVGSTTNTADVWAGAVVVPPPVDLDKMYTPSVVTAVQNTAEIFR